MTRLGGLCSAAFPLYTRILDEPKEDTFIVMRTLVVLANSGIKADRNHFPERVVAKLAHPHAGVRGSAVELLAQIGGARDAAPVVALLSDEKWEVPFAAAKTLAAIRDRRGLTARDAWLNSGTPHNSGNKDNEVLRKHGTKCRDVLKQRLGKAKPPSP